MIKIRKIKASINDKILFSGEDLLFKDGCKYILTGKNGSGKTSFLNSLIGWSSFVDIDYVNNSEITYQVQNSYFYKNTPRDNFRLLSINPNKIRGDLEILGIESLLDKHIDKLSGGERQKFIFLRALHSAKETFLLDEPFSQMDEGSKKIANNILDKWLKESPKRMIIMVSHDEISQNTYDYHVRIEDKKIKEIL